MQDEDALLHLPAGKAAVISSDSLDARDGQEETMDHEYRNWKDKERRKNIDDPRSYFHRNLAGYLDKWMPLYKSGFSGWAHHHPPALGKTDCTLLLALTESLPNWIPALRLAMEHARPPLKTIIAVNSSFQDSSLLSAQELSDVYIIRVQESSTRVDLLKAAAQNAKTTWCAVIEPGLVPCPGWNQELIGVALSSHSPRVQGTIWQDLQTLRQPRPWPWFFICKTDLLARLQTSGNFLPHDTAARLLPHAHLP